MNKTAIAMVFLLAGAMALAWYVSSPKRQLPCAAVDRPAALHPNVVTDAACTSGLRWAD